MEGMVNIAEALSHMDSAPAPEPEQQKPDYREYQRVTASAPHELAERRMNMAALFAKGMYQRAIAKIFGVSETTVNKEINKLVEDYQSAAKDSIGKKIAEEEALLYMVQLEAINAWFESKQGRVVNVKKRALEIKSVGKQFGRGRKGKALLPGESEARIMQELEKAFADPEEEQENSLEVFAQDEKVDEAERRESSAGEPRFLQIILECHDRRAKLFALYPKVDKEGLSMDDDDTQLMNPTKRASLLRNFLDKARQKRSQQLAITDADAKVTVEKMNGQPLLAQGQQQPIPATIFEKRAQSLPVIDIPAPETFVYVTDPTPQEAWGTGTYNEPVPTTETPALPEF